MSVGDVKGARRRHKILQRQGSAPRKSKLSLVASIEKGKALQRKKLDMSSRK